MAIQIQTQSQQTQIELIERSWVLVYKEFGENLVRLVMSTRTYNKVVELRGNFLVYKKQTDGKEDVLIAVKLKQKSAKEVRRKLLKIDNTTALAGFLFDFERAAIFMTPNGSEIWMFDDYRRKKKPLTKILKSLKINSRRLLPFLPF